MTKKRRNTRKKNAVSWKSAAQTYMKANRSLYENNCALKKELRDFEIIAGKRIIDLEKQVNLLLDDRNKLEERLIKLKSFITKYEKELQVENGRERVKESR